MNSYLNCLGFDLDLILILLQLCLALCSVPRWHILRHHLVLRSNVHVCEVRLGKLGPCGLILQNLLTVCWTQLNVVLQTKTNRKKKININTSWDLAVLPQNLPHCLPTAVCWTQLNENFRKHILCIVHLTPHPQEADRDRILTQIYDLNFRDFNICKVFFVEQHFLHATECEFKLSIELLFFQKPSSNKNWSRLNCGEL